MLRNVSFISIYASLALTSSHLSPLSAAPASLNEETAVQRALAHYPPLKVAELEMAKAQARFRWSGRFPNPELGLEAATDEFGLDEDEGSLAITFSQRFPVTDRLRREKELTRIGIDTAVWEIQEARRRLISDVKTRVVHLLALQEQRRVRQRMLRLNAKLIDYTDRGAKTGEIPRFDATQAELDASILEEAIRDLEVADEVWRGELRGLLGSESASLPQITGDLAVPPTQPATEATARWQEALANRPEMQLAKLAERHALAEIALAHAQRWEDIKVELRVERERAVDEPGGLETNRFVGLGLSIPLPFRSPTKSLTEVKYLEREQSQRRVTAVAMQIRNEVRTAAALLAKHYLLVKRYETLVETAHEYHQDIQASYQRGETSFTQMQQAQEQTLKIESTLIDRKKDYHLARIQLESLTASHPGVIAIAATK